MKKQKGTFILFLVLILLMAGAYLLYQSLSKQYTPDPLSNQETGTDSSSASSAPPAADFTVFDTDGNEVSLSDFLGKPVVLNYWASWCGPCQSEMPDFQSAYEELGEEIQFLMVNVTTGRETLDSAQEFISSSDYTFPVFYDLDLDASTAYGIYSLPTTYFIDTEGYAVAQARGAINAEILQEGIDLIYSE